MCSTEKQFEVSFLQVCGEVAPNAEYLAELTAQKGQGTLCAMFQTQMDVVKSRLGEESLYTSDVVPFMQKLGIGQWYQQLDATGKQNWEKSIRKLFQNSSLVASLGKELNLMENMSQEIMSGEESMEPADIMKFMMQPEKMEQLSALFQPERMTSILNNLPYLLGNSNLTDDMKNLQQSGLDIIKQNELE